MPILWPLVRSENSSPSKSSLFNQTLAKKNIYLLCCLANKAFRSQRQTNKLLTCKLLYNPFTHKPQVSPHIVFSSGGTTAHIGFIWLQLAAQSRHAKNQQTYITVVRTATTNKIFQNDLHGGCSVVVMFDCGVGVLGPFVVVGSKKIKK